MLSMSVINVCCPRLFPCPLTMSIVHGRTLSLPVVHGCGPCLLSRYQLFVSIFYVSFPSLLSLSLSMPVICCPISIVHLSMFMFIIYFPISIVYCPVAAVHFSLSMYLFMSIVHVQLVQQCFKSIHEILRQLPSSQGRCQAIILAGV